MIGRVGVYCGAIHRAHPQSWVTDNALYIAEKTDELLDDYLEWALRFANLNQYASQAAQPLLSGSRIYPVKIRIPPIELQYSFSNFLNRQKKLAVNLGGTFKSTDDLFNSLVQRAFKGEL